MLKRPSNWLAFITLGLLLVSVSGCVQLPANVEDELRAPAANETNNFRLRHDRESARQ